jgi:hypothetical protein
MNNNPNPQESASQAKQILEYMRQGNRITQLEAIEKFGCLRLSARIADISKMIGYPCRRERISVRNRNGKEVRVMSYFL